MFNNKKADDRFDVEKVSKDSTMRCYVLTDKETGIQYLATWVSTGGGITPLLDENGNITKVDTTSLKMINLHSNFYRRYYFGTYGYKRLRNHFILFSISKFLKKMRNKNCNGKLVIQNKLLPLQLFILESFRLY